VCAEVCTACDSPGIHDAQDHNHTVPTATYLLSMVRRGLLFSRSSSPERRAEIDVPDLEEVIYAISELPGDLADEPFAAVTDGLLGAAIQRENEVGRDWPVSDEQAHVLRQALDLIKRRGGLSEGQQSLYEMVA
jgi:hypothetical protein